MSMSGPPLAALASAGLRVGPASRPLRPALVLGLLLAAYAFVLAVRLGASPVHRTAEVRVEAVARGMVGSGDWLVPHVGDQVRLQKPPLYYWLVAAVQRVGETAGAASQRAPAAACSLLMLLVAWSWGRHASGASLGLLAAILLACFPGPVEFGRLGVAETLMALTSSAALLAFGLATATGSRRARGACVALLALGVLAKATPVLLTAVLPMALDRALAGRFRDVLGWRTARLAGLVLLPALLWYVAVLLTVPGGWEQILSFALLPFGVRLPEAAGNAAHVRPIWFHALTLLTLTLPVVPLLPLVVARAMASRGWKHAPGLRLAALAVGVPLLGFSLVPQKQDHYLLPLLPPLAVLMAETLQDAASRVATGARGLRVASLVMALLLAVGATVFALALRWAFDAAVPAAAALVAAVVVAAALVLRAGWHGRVLPCAGGLAAATLLIMAVWYASFDVERNRLDAEVASPAELARWDAIVGEHPLVGSLLQYEKSSAAEGL